MKIFQSPISLGFLLVEVFALIHLKPVHDEFVNPWFLQGCTGIPLAYVILIYLPIQWPDRRILFLRDKILSSGHLLALRFIVFGGTTLYLLDLLVASHK